MRFQRKDTEQVHVCLGARRPAAPRRAPLRRARAGRDLRRAVLVAAVPGRARGARPGLLRLLLLRPVPGHGPDRPVRRHAAGQPRRGDGGRGRRSCAGMRAEPGHRGGARAGQGERQGAHRPGAGVLGGAHEPARRLAAVRAAAARSRRS